MIDPKLHDWWSRKRRTDLSAVGTVFAGAGVSLRVILHALGQKKLTWYSLVYGDFNDDILLLAVDDKIASSFKNSPYPQIGPMQQVSDRRGGLTEYALNSDIQSALGVSIDENNFHIGHRELIQQRIYIHDDCFFEVEPVDGTELRKLIHSILKQHSFYLGSDVHWDGMLDEMAALLNMVEKVRIQSEPARQRMTLSWNDRPHSFLQRVLGLRSSRHIEIQDGKAKYSD